jgi:predicted DNA-binding transcriptional regulator AlpA
MMIEQKKAKEEQSTSTLIRKEDLGPRIDTAPTSINHLVEDGIFPAPIKIGQKAIACQMSGIEG